jgi:hypothetical protein
LWALFAAYAYALLIGTELPGEPAWNIQPHTLQSVVDESLDFFYIAPILDALGAPLPFPAPGVHPAELALFNGVNAWSLMFLGLLARDARGACRCAMHARCALEMSSFCSRIHSDDVCVAVAVAVCRGAAAAAGGVERTDVPHKCLPAAVDGRALRDAAARR